MHSFTFDFSKVRFKMSAAFRSYLLNILNNLSPKYVPQIRSGHHLRGKPPGVARTLEQRMTEMKFKDPELHYRVDIGLPWVNKERGNLKERLEFLKEWRKDPKVEKLARSRELLADLDAVREEHLKTLGPSHVKVIADHFGINRHLFGDAYFFPVVPLTILFDVGDVSLPVCYGNVIKPLQAALKPRITYTADEGSFWTLILTNPDGHFVQQDSEYVHWFIGNIPGSDVEKGEVIIDYLQPFPPKGTGYHRFVFILYKQEKEIDFSDLKKNGKCLNLSDRTFKTLDFYKTRQDLLTPAGLSFFQSDWDSSLTDFYHKMLEMKEPVFEYDFPPPYIRPQKWFALRQPFNLYMDKYRDPKQINKEFLVRKLKKVHPFKPTPRPLPYPNAQFFNGYVPSWLKLEITKSRLRWGRINDIE